MNDPIMRYLVDALASEYSKNDPLAYSFVSYRDDTEKETVCQKWRGRGIQPILYKKMIGKKRRRT